MSKLSAVIRHEYLTIIKQPSFWIIMLAMPLMIAAIFALTFFGQKASFDRIEEISKELKNVTIVDESGLINQSVVKSAELETAPSQQIESLRNKVQAGELEALVIFPADLKQSQQYQIYLSSNDLTRTSSVSSLASDLLKTSLFLPLGSPEVIALAQDGASANITTYKDGQQTAGFNEYIAPGIFLVLFYIVFAFSVSYMLTSISEEKENRSMEMVLTYVKPRDLILGKLIGVSLVTLTQIIFFAILALIGYWALQSFSAGTISLPAGIDVSKITIEFWPIFFGFGFLIVGFLMFAGYMTTVAALAPSSKEANSFSSVFFLGAFVPFYFITMIATDPQNPVVQFLTYFPLTSPVVDLVRNTVGNMSLTESWTALVTMILFMIFSIWLAVRAFRLGALEFGQTVKLSKLFKK